MACLYSPVALRCSLSLSLRPWNLLLDPADANTCTLVRLRELYEVYEPVVT